MKTRHYTQACRSSVTNIYFVYPNQCTKNLLFRYGMASATFNLETPIAYYSK